MLTRGFERGFVAFPDFVNMQGVYAGRGVSKIQSHEDAVWRLQQPCFADRAALDIDECGARARWYQISGGAFWRLCARAGGNGQSHCNHDNCLLHNALLSALETCKTTTIRRHVTRPLSGARRCHDRSRLSAVMPI